MAQFTTTTQVDPAVSTYYDRALLERALPALVYDQFGQTRNIKKKSGNTIKFRRYASLAEALVPLEEGTPPPAQQLSKTDLTAVVKPYGTYVAITDWVDYTVEDDVLNETSDLLSENMPSTIDTLLRDILSATASYNTCSNGSNGKTPTEFSETDINTAVMTLLGGNAKMISEVIRASTGIGTKPVRQAFFGVAHTEEISALEAISGKISTAEYPKGEPILQNEWCATGNVRWLTTTKCRYESSSPKIYYNLIFGKNAYGVVEIDNASLKHIFKPYGSGGTSDPLDQQATMGWKATFTARILNDAFMLCLAASNKAGS